MSSATYQPIPVGLERLYVVEKTQDGAKSYLSDYNDVPRRYYYELASALCVAIEKAERCLVVGNWQPWPTHGLPSKHLRTVFGQQSLNRVPQDRYSLAR